MLRQFEQAVTSFEMPRFSIWCFLRLNTRRRKGLARSLALTPPPPPQHQFMIPCSSVSTKSLATMLRRLRCGSTMPPRRTIWQGSFVLEPFGPQPALDTQFLQ